MKSAKLAARIQRRLGDRKIDVMCVSPETKLSLAHRKCARQWCDNMNKLISRALTMLAETAGSVLNNFNRAERLGWLIASADE